MKKQLLTLLFSVLLSPLALADVRIGVSIAQVDDVFLAQMRDYMVAHAKQLEGVTLQFEDAQGDVVRQLNQVLNFTSQGVDAIIINPVDTAATAKITDDAQNAHIPLVYVNRRGSTAPLAITVKVTCNVAAGSGVTYAAKTVGCVALPSLDSVRCLAMDNAMDLIQCGSNHLFRRRCQQVLGPFAAQKAVI